MTAEDGQLFHFFCVPLPCLCRQARGQDKMSLGGLFSPGLIRWEELLRSFFFQAVSQTGRRPAGRRRKIDPGEARDGGVVLSCQETDPVADGTV